MEKKRIVFIDYIRAIAPLMVMLVHASENFYIADSPKLGVNVSELANESNRFWVAFYDGGISRTCVPLFMVVSAFLLVPMKPGMSMSQFYKRRFKRILPLHRIHAALFFSSSFMGRHDMGAELRLPETAAFQFSSHGRASVVYVPAHLSLSHHSGGIALAGESQCQRREDLYRTLCVHNPDAMDPPLHL